MPYLKKKDVMGFYRISSQVSLKFISETGSESFASLCTVVCNSV